MTDVYVQKILTKVFLTINDFSGKHYLKFDDTGNPLNVLVPNKYFDPKTPYQFFVLDFLPDTPEPSAMGTDAGNRWTGIFQIDINTPLDKGEKEAADKYDWLSKLFARGKYFEKVLIQNCYRATVNRNEKWYTTTVRVEWAAELER